ncbi:hypothetical protein AB0903_28265 [Streptomyces sp. NPDC048389]|uniref:hypothetical protein n=1 Tax=Streptomyces sp. NPDC048389 TaxID=3154622 RepID=UPI00345586CA
MRARDIRIGETYMVCVPQRLPRSLRDRLPRDRATFAADMRLHLHRGKRFDLTVTDVHLGPPASPTVDGVETLKTSNVALPLTSEQASLLGLPLDTTYEIQGLLRDADGEPVELPTTLAHTGLPARWLLPLGTPTVLDPLSVAYYRFRVREQATGMTPEGVSEAADEAQESERETAGRALDNYEAEDFLHTRRVEHKEWRRIEAVIAHTGMKVYAPSSDPEISENELSNPTRRHLDGK